MSVKNDIVSLRKKAGLSVYELSKRCGFISNGHVLSQHVKKAEAGHQVKIETALKIYRELKKAGVCENFEDVFWLSDDAE
ncbi:MAG: transcriptional regulator [Moraxella sp.]|nr:transcriptional regulator [Moraxella sp.]